MKLDPITRVDQKTFYVRSQSEPDKDPYMVFNSTNVGWCCDCMHFTLNIDDSGKGKDCKHITLVKKTYSLQ